MIEVLKAGLLDTVQDSGRSGWQQYGVTPGGVMDVLSFRTANALLGNRPDAAVLEMTYTGPVLKFREACTFALCGGSFTPFIAGCPVPLFTPVHVQRGTVLTIGAAQQGCRLVMAVAGGLDVQSVLGSRSTFLRACLGGFEGRRLAAGDVLPAGPAAELLFPERYGKVLEPFTAAAWSAARSLRPVIGPAVTIRYLRGRNWHLFAEKSRRSFCRSAYRIDARSDRMGCRLEGAPLRLQTPEEMVSDAVTYGTVQVPPDGQPIILMADRQTTGGYPEIGQVISVDQPALAQARPGTEIHFQETTLKAAQQELMARNTALAVLQAGVRQKMQGGGI